MLIVLSLEVNSLHRFISLTSHTATALLVLKGNLNFLLIRNYEDFIKFLNHELAIFFSAIFYNWHMRKSSIATTGDRED